MAAFASAQRASAAVMNSSVETRAAVEVVEDVVETDWMVESSPPQAATVNAATVAAAVAMATFPLIAGRLAARRTAPARLPRTAKLRAKDSNLEYLFQREACCRLHQPAELPQESPRDGEIS